MPARKATSLFDDSGTVERILSAVREAGMPVSIDYVATNVGLNWPSTRAVLMQLSLEGRLNAVKTTKSWVFFVKSRDRKELDSFAQIGHQLGSNAGETLTLANDDSITIIKKESEK